MSTDHEQELEQSIPLGLGFDDIIHGKTLPPCSLIDFMDYLLYIEHNAENLQFYLWYTSYTQRFNALPESEKSLSPKWIHENSKFPELRKKNAPEDIFDAVRIETKPSMLQYEYNPRGSIFLENDLYGKIRSGSLIKDDEGGGQAESLADSEVSIIDITSRAGLKWQPFTIQPFRDEVNRIIRHYLAFTAPRELNLSHRTRALVLHALQHTTHPSAFHPALFAAEASLRGQSHLNFIRWSICNGSKPRIFFVRGISATAVAMGTSLSLILICTSWSRWWRLIAGVLWLSGGIGLIAAARGLCVILHNSHHRMSKPWEEESGIGIELSSDKRAISASNLRLPPLDFAKIDLGPEKDQLPGHEVLKDEGILSFFGPKNQNIEECAWYERDKRRGMWRKVFAQGVWTQEERLRLLQDKIVLGSILWATIGTLIALAVVLCIPELAIL